MTVKQIIMHAAAFTERGQLSLNVSTTCLYCSSVIRLNNDIVQVTRRAYNIHTGAHTYLYIQLKDHFPGKLKLSRWHIIHRNQRWQCWQTKV